MHTMKTTIDAAGRLVIPKELRRLAGLRAGTVLEIRWQDGRIEIEPAAAPVQLVQKGRLLVAAGEDGEAEPLTADIVEATRASIQQERGAIE
jgi:AbrB family looped-hinge helix DNA binding protein